MRYWNKDGTLNIEGLGIQKQVQQFIKPFYDNTQTPLDVLALNEVMQVAIGMAESEWTLPGEFK